MFRGSTYFPAVTGAVLNNDSNSLYLTDHWVISSRLSADLGRALRARERGVHRRHRQHQQQPHRAARWPLAYDVNGDGDKIVHVTYGQYSGRYNEAQIGTNSPVGNSPSIDAIYRGPAGQGLRLRARARSGELSRSRPGNAAVDDPTQNVFMANGIEVAADARVLAVVRREPVRRTRIRRGQLRRPGDQQAASTTS